MRPGSSAPGSRPVSDWALTHEAVQLAQPAIRGMAVAAKMLYKTSVS